MVKSNGFHRSFNVAVPIGIGLLGLAALLLATSFADAAGGEMGDRREDAQANGHLLPQDGVSPTLQLLAFQPSQDGYLLTVRLDDALPHVQYVISSYHHTDIDYGQDAVTVTADGDGVASAQVWSRYTYQGAPAGYVFARLGREGVLEATSNSLDAASLQAVADFGSHLAADPLNDDWIYRPSPPGADEVRIWVRDAAGRPGLAGTVRVRSAQAGYVLPEQPLIDAGGGLYTCTWSITSLPRADDYRLQLTLQDGAGGLSGVDAFVRLSGRAMWVWGEAVGEGNPQIWAILTNGDHDGDGIGDRDEWLAFCNAPHGSQDPYATTSYLSVYPYISYAGTLYTETVQAFLAAAHGAGEVRVEALAGTHQWVESDQGLQDGKAMCDAILAFNRATAAPAGRFGGIHYDVEHDDWYAGGRWERFLELIAYCQGQVDQYNQEHAPIVLGVDTPPHFLTGPEASGQIKSNWDVMHIVDTITLMDYRDFADQRWDGRTDGIVPRAEGFLADGNALGKPVVIGVELTANPYDHVTFFEECPMWMERELRAASRALASEWAYRGIAMHTYGAWKAKRACGAFLPLVIKEGF